MYLKSYDTYHIWLRVINRAFVTNLAGNQLKIIRFVILERLIIVSASYYYCWLCKAGLPNSRQKVKVGEEQYVRL